MELTAARWRKSSLSTGNGGNCVEVASNLPGIVAVRDSKDHQGPALLFTRGAWAEFVTGIQAGALDRG